MTQRTADIIGISKKISLKYKTASTKRNIAQYIGNITNVDPNSYSDWQIDNIIKLAMFDYVDSADKPSDFLEHVFCEGVSNSSLPPINKIILAFSFVNIRKNGKWVNGFNQELIYTMDKNIEIDKSEFNKDIGYDEEDSE